MSNRFRITYGNGAVEEVITDAADVADQINRTFGLTVDEAAEHGVAVEMLAPGEEHTPLDLTNREADEDLLQDLVKVETGTVEPDKLVDPNAPAPELVGTPESDPAQQPVHVHRGVEEVSVSGDGTVNDDAKTEEKPALDENEAAPKAAAPKAKKKN